MNRLAGILGPLTKVSLPCEHFMVKKATRNPFKKAKRAYVLQQIHSNVCDPMNECEGKT